MEYSIKETSKNVDITEQGLYKRIRLYFDDYKKKGYIVIKQIEQPSGTREQVFLTEEGLKDLLKTKHLKETCYNKDFLKFSQEAKHIEQPIKPSLDEFTGAEATGKAKTYADVNNAEIIKLLNQTIADLKADNKRLIEKLDKQEERLDQKLKEQKEEFNEAFKRQNEAYQNALNTISLNFNNLLQRIPPPQEQEQTEQTITTIEQKEEGASGDIASNIEDTPKKHKSFFSRLFKGEW